MAINELRNSNLAECRVNMYEQKETAFMNKETSRAGVF
jgi:hypothetical protein